MQFSSVAFTNLTSVSYKHDWIVLKPLINMNSLTNLFRFEALLG